MKTAIIETAKDFLNFLKNPVEKQDPIQTTQHKSKRFFAILAIEFVVSVIILAIIAGIEALGFINTDDHAITSMLEELPIWLMMLFGAVLAPVLEELVFRLPLRFKYNYFARFMIFAASVTGRRNKIKTQFYLRNFWRKNFRLIFYLSALLFSLLHLTNFEISTIILIFAPILIASQFFGGLVLGYLRVRYNLLLAILSHSLFNTILFTVSLIVMIFPTEKLNIETEEYRIKIEEVSPRTNLNSFADSNFDSVNYSGVRMKTIISLLFEKDEFLVETNNPQKIRKKINLDFVNYSKDISASKNIIISHLTQLYNFTVEHKKRQQEIWEIQIKDSLKLRKHQTTQGDKIISRTNTNGKIEMKNVDLSSVAGWLTSVYEKKIYIVNETTWERFDITINSNKDFDELIEILNSEYGISLKQNWKELEYISVNFEK